MGKVLSPWCKQAKIAMIELDMTVVELAEKIGKSREYTSAVVNGRIYAEPVVKAISLSISALAEANVACA